MTSQPLKSFKEKYDLQQRIFQSSQQLNTYPNYVPVIIEKHKRCTIQSQISKSKYLVEKTYKFQKLQEQIQEKLNLKPQEAIFFYVSDSQQALPINSMDELYQKYKDQDGFLYLNYTNMETYGYQQQNYTNFIVN